MARNETRDMESVIALAEELNFTLAAQKVHVSQPVISRNIADLEAKLGGRLFDRDRKRVQLNKAGRAYVEHARVALLYSDRAFTAARAAMQGADLILHVGRSPYTDPFLSSTLFSVQRSRFPQMRIELSSQYSFDLTHEVLAGALDLAIATEPPESPLLTTAKIAEVPFYIAMSVDDVLARHAYVTFEQLADRCWILFERRLHPTLYDNVMIAAEVKGSMPHKIQHITAPEEAFPFVSEGDCVAFVVKTGALRIARDGVTVRPLAEDPLSLKTYLISRSDNRSKMMSALVRSFMRRLDRFQVRAPNQSPFERQTGAGTL
ncbi:LysR family transcriptional regulator [Acidicapsa ligni]|uniref:LysR family transcriptional regulator n=1 Tax=Acidicapsa ligni TaxID=542300 RepID=UPI0021E00185|nr:LysR family transcriptional regulator [Acidicapsa ligni]